MRANLVSTRKARCAGIVPGTRTVGRPGGYAGYSTAPIQVMKCASTNPRGYVGPHQARARPCAGHRTERDPQDEHHDGNFLPRRHRAHRGHAHAEVPEQESDDQRVKGKQPHEEDQRRARDARQPDARGPGQSQRRSRHLLARRQLARRNAPRISRLIRPKDPPRFAAESGLRARQSSRIAPAPATRNPSMRPASKVLARRRK